MADCTRLATPDPLQRRLHRQGVHHGGQHAHIVGGGAVDALGGAGQCRGKCCRRRSPCRAGCRPSTASFTSRGDAVDGGDVDAESPARPSTPRRRPSKSTRRYFGVDSTCSFAFQLVRPSLALSWPAICALRRRSRFRPSRCPRQPGSAQSLRSRPARPDPWTPFRAPCRPGFRRR